MSTILIDVPPKTYESLLQEAHETGKSSELLTLELLQATYGDGNGHSHQNPKDDPQAVRKLLEQLGQSRPLSETLRAMIMPDVTLEEVIETLSQTADPSLSQILDEQRGPKL